MLKLGLPVQGQSCHHCAAAPPKFSVRNAVEYALWQLNAKVSYTAAIQRNFFIFNWLTTP